MVIHEAYRDGTLQSDPSRAYRKARYTNPQRQYLVQSEIELIEKYIEDGGKYSNVANWFLFGCYCGLRFADIAKFKPAKSVVDGRVIVRTSKSKTDVTIRIHPRLQKVLDRLGKNPVSTQKYNYTLSLIAEEIGLKKSLTSHIARHTFATLFLTLGGSIEVLSKLLGHTKVSTTQIYGKIINSRIDDEVERVFG